MTPEKALGFIAFLLALLAVKSGCIAMSVLLEKLVPAFTARAVNAYKSRGSFILGAVNGIVLAFLFVLLANSQLEALKLVGMVILLVLIAGIMTGYMIAYHDMGRRLRGDRDWSSTRTIFFGGVAAELAFMTPVLGQVLSVGVLFRGLGAVISAILSRGVASPAGGVLDNRDERDKPA
ncbi:MAG TPA: hypothetical protein PK869_01885 [Candidatus Hydrogenedentes bacterium]|nr:hypothetical protein [Candidatus Hydrogenedentota bacterium]